MGRHVAGDAPEMDRLVDDSIRAIGAEIKEDFPALKYGKGYDNCWMINGYEPGQLQSAAKLYSPQSGRMLEVLTTQPAVQIYTIECQHCPDSPNKPDYPSTVLRPENQFEEAIIWQFSVV